METLEKGFYYEDRVDCWLQGTYENITLGLAPGGCTIAYWFGSSQGNMCATG